MPTVVSTSHPLGTSRSVLLGAAASGAVLALSLAMRALAGRPLEDGGSASYPWSGLIHSQVSVVTVLLVAGCCFLGARRWMVSPRWVAAGTIAWPLLALVAEVRRDGTSHNLLPLEVMMWSVVVVPAMLATHLGRRSMPQGKGDAPSAAPAGLRTPVAGLPQPLRDWTPSTAARRAFTVAGALLLLAGLSGGGLVALGLPLGILSLMIGALGRIPIRRRWWHRYVR
jgi:hypothetical protein